MLSLGDKIKIINGGGELSLANHHYLRLMEIESSKFVSHNMNNYVVEGKEGIIIRIDVEMSIYFIQFEDGGICAMYENDIINDKLYIYLEIVND